MPTDSRAQTANLSDARSAETTALHQNGVCAAGQAHGPSNKGHPGNTSLTRPIADEDREALRRLIEAGKMIRRDDGRWGTPSKPLITGAVAARLKTRCLAVSGFDRKTIAPSDKGLRLYAEMKNGNTR